MTTRARTLNELEKKLVEAKKNVSTIETHIGQQLLGAQASSVNQQIRDEYALLGSQKQELLETITDIQKRVARREEIKEQIKGIKTHLAELQKGWNERLEQFGSVLSEHYIPAEGSRFETQFAEITAEKKVISSLEKQAGLIQTEMETQGFFARLATQVKMVGMNNNISVHKRAVCRLEQDVAQQFLDSDEEKEQYRSGTFNMVLSEYYEKCLSLKEEMAGRKQLQMSLIDEDISLKEQLLSLNVTDSGARCIESLRKDFHKKEVRQNELCQQTGHLFANLYVTPDGDELMAYEGLAGEYLPDIRLERKHIQEFSRRIEILRLAGIIDETEKKCVSLRKIVTSNTQKIEQLQKDSAEQNDKIAAAEALLDNLRGHLEELLADEDAATKLLVATKEDL